MWEREAALLSRAHSVFRWESEELGAQSIVKFSVEYNTLCSLWIISCLLVRLVNTSISHLLEVCIRVVGTHPVPLSRTLLVSSSETLSKLSEWINTVFRWESEEFGTYTFYASQADFDELKTVRLPAIYCIVPLRVSAKRNVL